MFGFPFITSLVVVLAGVVVMSLLVNKGSSKSPTDKGATLNAPSKTQASQ